MTDREACQVPELASLRLVIRAFERKDLPAFSRYRAQEVIARYQSWQTYCLKDAINLLESMDYRQFGKEGLWFQLAICSHEGILMGDLALHFIDSKQIEIGFTLDPDYQGKGYAKEALTLCLDYLFNQLNQHRVIAITDALNDAAANLLTQTGFRLEAHYEQNIYFKGAWGGELSFALLKREFEQP